MVYRGVLLCTVYSWKFSGGAYFCLLLDDYINLVSSYTVLDECDIFSTCMTIFERQPCLLLMRIVCYHILCILDIIYTLHLWSLCH